MTFLLKDPDAALDYGVDWGAEYLNGDILIGSSWSVTPDEPGGIRIAGSSFDPTMATVTADGGLPGRIYRLVNHVTLASGLTDTRTITLRVEKR
jgi:hypothetical protein